MKIEQYKTIPFAPKYAVSNLGNVMNLKTKQVLKQTPNHKGYPQLQLMIDGLPKSYRVHRLVAETYLPNPENRTQVNHKDGVKTNNTLANLEWVTSSENMKHSFLLGLHSQRGTNNNSAKLTEEQVRQIKTLLQQKVKHKILAEQFGVSRVIITQINTGVKWSQVTI
jgi:hypothetical protein